MTRRQLLKWTAATATPAVAVARSRGADHHARNFHTVEPGVLYRSGQLTATGLEAILRLYGIRTVVAAAAAFAILTALSLTNGKRKSA